MEVQRPFNYELFRQQAVQQLRTGEHSLIGIQKLLAPVIKDILDTALQSDDYSNKTIDSRLAVDTRDIKTVQLINNARPNRHLTRPNYSEEFRRKRIEREILEQYEKGNSYEAIQERIHTTYKEHFDAETLIKITNQILPQMQAWQRRPIQTVYAYLWTVNRMCHLWQDGELYYVTTHSIIGIDLEGNRDILGHYVDSRRPEEFWPDLLHNLKNRGLQDPLIICIEKASELRPIINKVYPNTHVHESIMHMMWNSLLHITGNDSQKIRKDLQAVYQASSLTESALNWQTVKSAWGARYPLLVETWDQNWESIIGPMQYPDLVRKLTHGTSLVAICQEMLIKSTKVNGFNTTEVELLKALYSTSKHTLSKYKIAINKWGLIIQQLAVVFGERVKYI